MAPLPINNTARYKVYYTNSGRQHVSDVRSADSPGVFAAKWLAVGAALGTLMTATVIDEVQFCASGQTVFNTVVTGEEGNGFGTGAGTTLVRASYVNFIGRSSGGRRVRLAFFGTTDLGTDFRFVAGENAGVDAAIASLQGASNNFICIDGLAPIWKSYANSGFNAFLQRDLRP